MAALAVMLYLFVASLVTINVNGLPPLGSFIATRGKRSIEDDASINTELVATRDPIISDLIANNSTSFRTIPVSMNDLPELTIFKRAPSGFMGMRGKKENEYSDYFRRPELEVGSPNLQGKYFSLNTPLRLINNPFPKRRPSGFVGMRGKKLLLVDNGRSPRNFMEMQSRNDLTFNGLDDDNLQLFQALENEQNLLNHIKQIYNGDLEENNKRAPSSGFFGMRGKKRYEKPTYDDDEITEKRAPSGFLGMRGKKTLDFSYDSAEDDKRAPMGFFGMRGKKDVSAQIEEQKRSSLAQLFGIRGKKQPLNSGFFGMRGKKQPMEFRGKFVGVRGKKALSSSLQQLEEQLDDIENTDVRTNFRSVDEDSTAKRAPSGFMGMRGKKWPDELSFIQE